MPEKEFYHELISALKERKLSKNELSRLKVKLCKKYGVREIPTDIQVLLHIDENDLKKINIITKPTRTISGVSVVAIMSEPYKCPHGECSMCPSKTSDGVPQSYTGKEPATMRGIRNNFDPYLQIFNRLEQYVVLGQNFDKVELIVMGGTFPSFPKKYQEDFVKYSYKALNDFSDLFFKKNVFEVLKFREFFLLPGKVNDDKRTKEIHKKILALKGKCSLVTEQKKNEKSNVRCVALCIETRPDYSKKEHINQMLKFGVTRVEIGVQSTYNSVLRKINRGHSVEDTIKATQLLKDSFLKVGYHMMPGLPGSNKNKDIAMFKEIFSNSGFMPDALKIYPCMVVKGTKLYDDWKKGKFIPITTPEAVEIITESKKYVPKWCRILRVQRDIPTYVTEAGVDRTNLRQYVDEELKKKGITCNCIRCREPKNRKINWKRLKIISDDYNASGGTEIFISIEDTANNILLGMCRLRIPNKPFRKEITSKSAGIRELHVYGSSVSLGEKGRIQHKGIGKKLLQIVEKIAKEKYGIKKLFVISGVGVREYYSKLGYKRDGPYMSKYL